MKRKLGDPVGSRPTFGRPETSSLKTSFQEKISLQTATGSFHPNTQTLEVLIRPPHKNRPKTDGLCVVTREGVEPPTPTLGRWCSIH